MVRAKGIPIRGSWTNQAQFVFARNIKEKKLRYGLSIECAPLPDSEKTGGSVDQDGWRLLSQLNTQDFKRQIDELLTQDGWTILARNWEDNQHDEIVAFLVAAESNELYDDQDGTEAVFDAAVLMKVLPKFHGSHSRLAKPLCAVLAWCANPETPDVNGIQKAPQENSSGETVAQAVEASRYRSTAERVQRMLSRLYTDGFAAFG
jgi:hypothetical protein